MKGPRRVRRALETHLKGFGRFLQILGGFSVVLYVKKKDLGTFLKISRAFVGGAKAGKAPGWVVETYSGYPTVNPSTCQPVIFPTRKWLPNGSNQSTSRASQPSRLFGPTCRWPIFDLLEEKLCLIPHVYYRPVGQKNCTKSKSILRPVAPFVGRVGHMTG